MTILAIDPGTYKSGIVVYDPVSNTIEHQGIHDNSALARMLRYEKGAGYEFDEFAIEMIARQGMPVGQETFDTCVWIGRFIEAYGKEPALIKRRDVKMCLCGSMRAKDANIRQAILDRFPCTGGGKTPQIGTKKDPGPLYGMASHMWAALAVAITFVGKQEEDELAKLKAERKGGAK